MDAAGELDAAVTGLTDPDEGPKGGIVGIEGGEKAGMFVDGDCDCADLGDDGNLPKAGVCPGWNDVVLMNGSLVGVVEPSSLK